MIATIPNHIHVKFATTFNEDKEFDCCNYTHSKDVFKFTSYEDGKFKDIIYWVSDDGVECKLTNGDHYVIKPDGTIITKGNKS